MSRKDNVLSIVDCIQQDKADAYTLLRDVQDLQPKGVIVFAFLDDGSIQTNHSGYLDKLSVIGALEVAKMSIWYS